VIRFWIMTKLERIVLVLGLMIWDWIVVKSKRQGYKKFLKDSDIFWMVFQVWFACDQSTEFGVITVW